MSEAGQGTEGGDKTARRAAAARALVRELVRRLQEEFYPETVGAKGRAAGPFYADLRMLRLCVTWPAGFWRRRGFALGRKRYREALETLIAEVKANRQIAPEQMGNRGRYLLTCVQRWWERNWEPFYEEAKAARAVPALVAKELARLTAEPRAEEEVVDVLRAAAAVLEGERRARARARQGGGKGRA